MSKAGLRIVLNFDREIYHRESKIWYFMDPIITPNIGKMLGDIASKLKINEEQVCVYINGIIAPKWSSTCIIDSAEDDIWIKSAPLCVTNIAPVQESRPQCSITIENSVHKKFNKNVTPTGKDKYRNRSKVYTRPPATETVCTESIPVVTALPSSSKTTLSYVEADLKTNSSSLLQKMVSNSMSKSKVMVEKVLSITKQSDSSDSSMTSDSSDEEEAEKPAPAPVAKSQDKESESEKSEEEDGEHELEEGEPPPKIRRKPDPSSSEESSGEEEEEEEEEEQKTMSVDEDIIDYSKLKDLVGMPQPQDKLAFKMLDLNESYNPVISAYKEGVILKLDPSSQNVIVRILRGVIAPTNGRFAMVDDSEDPASPVDTIELNIRQMIEPKIIESS